MIRGIVNEYLLPTIPVRVKKLDGEWQKLSILLDTGSEAGFMLAETTVSQHGIAVRHDYNLPASIGPLQGPGNSIPMPPYWVELQMEETSRVAEAEILETDDFSSVIGPAHLSYRRGAGSTCLTRIGHYRKLLTICKANPTTRQHKATLAARPKISFERRKASHSDLFLE